MGFRESRGCTWTFLESLYRTEKTERHRKSLLSLAYMLSLTKLLASSDFASGFHSCELIQDLLLINNTLKQRGSELMIISKHTYNHSYTFK